MLRCSAQSAISPDNSSSEFGPAKTGSIMRIDAISIGNTPPDDINVIIEVPVGGQPIKLIVSSIRP